MPRKPNQDKASPEVKPKEDPKADEVEDTPIVKELKQIDDKYLEIERKYLKEAEELKRKYEELYKPILTNRTKLLVAQPEGDSEKTGTPACKAFWVQAMNNHPAFEDLIQEWDEPVLEFLKDITCEVTGEDDKNFKLSFEFEENAYFEHKVVTLDFKAEEENPYTGEITVKSITCDPSEILWKSGKDITVEKTQKKVKGGGAKKSKAKGKETLEPRDSFFRRFLVSMTSEDEDLPKQIACLPEIADCGADEEEILEGMMQEIYEAAQELKDRVIPFAVRWYTGEAAPDDDDDDDEDEESEEEGDDSESEEEPPKGKKKAQPKKGGQSSPGKGSPAGGPAAAPKEECKQQ